MITAEKQVKETRVHRNPECRSEVVYEIPCCVCEGLLPACRTPGCCSQVWCLAVFVKPAPRFVKMAGGKKFVDYRPGESFRCVDCCQKKYCWCCKPGRLSACERPVWMRKADGTGAGRVKKVGIVDDEVDPDLDLLEGIGILWAD